MLPGVVLVLQELDVPREAFERALPSGLSARWGEAALGAEEAPSVRALVTVRTPVDEALLARYAGVRVVAVAFTGFDVVDVAACKQRGIAVCNVPAYSTDSVAELAIGLTLTVLRRIVSGDAMLRAGGWGAPAGVELAGKTVGIVGTGATGMRTAELFRAFRCHLLGWSRTRRPEFTGELRGAYCDTLEELFARCDIVSVHVPLNEHTRGLVSRQVLSRLRPHAVLVNTARGAVCDEDALAELALAGRFRVALDVYSVEPLPASSGLRSLAVDSGVLLPHVAFKTEEALLRRAQVTAANLAAFARGESANRVA